jgi:hypothetical protein
MLKKDIYQKLQCPHMDSRLNNSLYNLNIFTKSYLFLFHENPSTPPSKISQVSAMNKNEEYTMKLRFGSQKEGTRAQI